MINRRVIIAMVNMLFLITNVHAQQWMDASGDQPKSFFEIKKSFESYWAGKDIKNKSVIKGKGWKPFKRWEWFMEQRVDEKGFLNPTALWNGWLEKKSLFKSNQKNTDVAWTNLGPQTSYPSGGGAGRVNCITFDPVNQNIIWVGSPSGGLWKTVNGGTAWSNSWDELPNLGISSIVIDHVNNDTMYVATGDGDAGDTYSIGILKSTDEGITWNTTGLSFTVSNGYRIRKLVMHPVNNRLLMAVTSNGIYRTTDAGSNWSVVRSGSHYDIEMLPGNSDIWYASTGNQVYKSTNSGAGWFLSNSGLPSSGTGRIALAVTPFAPGYLYALLSNTSDYGFKGFYLSRDSAKTWTTQSTTPNLLGWETNGSDAGGQGWYDLVTAATPTDSLTVYVGGVNIWKSTNGGTNWTLNAHWYGGGGKPYVHADQHAFEFQPNSAILWAGHDGGINKTSNGGSIWSDMSHGLGIHQFYRIGVSQTNANLVYGGTQDNGSDKYLNGIWTNELGGDGMEALVDHSNENIAYGEYYYGYMERTMNGGGSWTSIDNGVLEEGAWVTPFIIHPDTATILFKATTRIYKTTDRGTLWYPISAPLTGSVITSLAISESNPKYLYASNSSYMYRTTNGGVKWDTIAVSGISYIAVHPEEPLTLWTTKSNYTSGQKVFKSIDGGSVWTNVSTGLPNIPFNCITVHPYNGNHIYAGSDLGVFHSSNGGTSWEIYDQGLPNVIVNELEIQRSSNKLRAATYGRGLWETTVSIIDINGGQISTLPDRVELFQNYPNPFNPGTAIRYQLISNGHVALVIYNALGQEVRTLVNSPQSAGMHTVNWDGKNNFGKDVSSGIYMYRLVTGNGAIARKMILIR